VNVSIVTAQAALRGIRIELRKGRVRCRPSTALTPELRDAIRAIKPDLRRLLPDIGRNPPRSFPPEPLDPTYWDSVGYPNASLTPIVEERPCRCCFGTRWWRRAGSTTQWFCIRCHVPMCAEVEVRDA
jgi:hypothetical protein